MNEAPFDQPSKSRCPECNATEGHFVFCDWLDDDEPDTTSNGESR